MTKATNAKRLALALKRHSVEYIFGQSNPVPITMECGKLGIKQIGYRQENAGSYMAMGYGMATGKVPVVTAQNGPAATLIVPGLAECLKASHPIIAVVQEVRLLHEEKNAFQELDHEKLFSGVAKWVKRISLPERIEDFVDLAFTVAASGKPGPAVLLCPTDLFYEDFQEREVADRAAGMGVCPLDRMVADPEKIAQAAELLANAHSPVIYAGGGVISAGAQPELRALQKECALPVATTTMGKGSVDETDALTIGPIGYYMGKRSSSEYLKPLVQGADVILLVGNRTNQNGTDSWTLLPQGATYIHIDIDPTEIGRNYEAVRLVGDAKLTLAALKEQLEKKDLSKRQAKKQEVEHTIKQARAKFRERAADVVRSNVSPIRIERFLAELDEWLTDDHIIVADASFSSIWLANYIQAKGNRKFLFPRGIAGLGWGLPMAVGAKIAQPGRKVFCLSGDGGFAHVWAELETCKRLGVDVVLAVINNSVLGYQKWSEVAGYREYTNVCDLGTVDHVKIAQACGIDGVTVKSSDDITGALDAALQAKGSFLIDIMADPKCIPPIPAYAMLDDE